MTRYWGLPPIALNRAKLNGLATTFALTLERPYAEAMIRDLEHQDYSQVTALQNAHYLHHFDETPEQNEQANARAREKYAPQFGQRVLEREGEIRAGVLFYPPAELERVFRFQLYGDPAHYSALYLDFLARVAPFSPRAIESVVREDMPDMAFLAHAGLTNRYQSWGAHLELAGFDFAKFQPLEEKLFLEGFEVHSLEAGGSESAWKDLYTLYLETRGGPYNPTTTPQFADFEAFRPSNTTDRALYATSRGKVVGYALLGVSNEVQLEYMAVHPAQRGQGLGLLLAAKALEWAKIQNWSEAGTGGNVLDLAMLRIVQKLGFALEPMWCTWWLELNSVR